VTGSIVDLEEAVASLPASARAAAGRILTITTTTGRLEPPPEMHDWIRKFFGSVDAVREQRIVRVSNQVTFEGALFNELRALRPMEVKGGDEVRATIASSANDPFCRPETGTPADIFGRVEGAHGITASNVAKYDAFHGVLVFKEHDPLAPMDASVIRDHLTTARRWAERLDEAREEIERCWGQAHYRKFRLYLWGTAHAFATNLMSAYRLVLERPTRLENLRRWRS